MRVVSFEDMNKDRLLGVGVGVVVVASVLISIWIGTYTVPRNIPSGTHWTPTLIHHVLQLGPQRPDWAIPVALAVGIGGATLALLIYRPRRVRP